ncbi:uncharacterized protein F5891DRAFT_1281019 [Suillus fuscotomentosus]|uniref:Uncharacterized protein n=1 Tax=Suillus fuscotomentosus TaxID=1912939 RepID=A0AAD4DWZ5_9AGAM|nr:uncharacterized protein F5891DRAFT_1281019 [Suillus fuscotomentosus]KAG1895656.1 hypothetical protein F5891DRAFT_1281019 [Suillus fuscotomentosus]
MATGKTRSTSVGPGNSNIRVPTPTNRTRTSYRNTISLLLPRDEIIQQEYDVKDKESSIAFLEKSPFRQPGTPISNESLLLTILYITQYTGIPRIVVEGLRATVLLLEDNLNSNANAATPNIQQITESISASLSTQVAADLSSSLSAHVIAAISPHVASILTASETLKTNVDEIAKLKDILTENSKEDNGTASAAATRAEKAADAVLNSIADVKNVVESLNAPLSTTKPGTSKSYSEIVQQHTQTPAPVSAAVARAATRDRQILIDPVLGQTLFAPEAM